VEKFGKYELVKRIGSGGMAEVFLARTRVAQGLDKQLVIKKIHPAYNRSRHFQSMFVDEANIALKLNHPNVVQVFDFGQEGQTFFLAMEFVEGLDLLRLMQEAARQKRYIPLGICAYIVQQVAKGLDYAHRRTDDFGDPLGIVHRDISPQNVLLSFDGAVKIVDFGIARARDVHEEEGVVKGKFAYMAPEQARGEQVDRRADVFSAGVVLFELCCARPLFPGKGKEVLEKVKAGAIPAPRGCNSEIPPTLEETIVKALAFHRDDRFQTGRDLQNALARFQFHLAQTQEQLVDSGTLAQFISQVIPSEGRRIAPRPPTAPGLESEPGSGAGDPSDAELDRVSGEVEAPRRQTTRAPVRERKHVFVVAGQVTGLAALEAKHGDAAAAMLDDFYQVARDIAFKEEAIVHRIRKGALLMIVGLPVAGEDDASRTIRLARALVEALDGIGLDDGAVRLAVGIQRGVAVLKNRDPANLDYTMDPKAALIASRLAAEAHGAEVLCGGTVYRAAKDDWHFERLTTIDLPSEADTPGDSDESSPGTSGSSASGTGGATQRAAVYRLRGPKERAQRIRERSRFDIDLIGRELELKALRDVYREVAVAGEKRQVVVFAEPGLGRRALLSAFLANLTASDATVFRAVGRNNTFMIPFGILADLGRDFFGLPEGADASEIRKRAQRVLPLLYPGSEDSAEARSLLEAAITVLGGSSTSEMDAGERRELLVRAMTRVEHMLPGDKPLVIIIEDVHYADDESLELFRALLRQPSRRGVLAILTARPDDRVGEIAESIGAKVIRLEELSRDDALRLIKDRFVADENIDELAAQIVARAGGNPLFINEMVDSLVDRKILLPEPEGSEFEGQLRWSVREASLAIPSSIESLLVTKIDQMPPETKQAIMHAAILGRRFELASLEGLLGRQAGGDLETLVKRGMLIADGDGAFHFKSELAMTVAYRLVPDDERTARHRAIAEAMLASDGYRRGTDDAVIARHLELAGDAAAAADRYLEAASHAVDVGGNTDAFRQLTRALKLIPQTDHPRRFRARCQREEILRRLARRSAQLREIESLRTEAEAIGEPDKLAIAYARMASYYVAVGKLAAASQAARPALENARAAGDPLAEAEALRIESAIARLEGRYDDALELVERALDLLSDDDASKLQRAMILNNRGHVLWNSAKLSDAIESYAEALVIYRMLKLPRFESRMLNNMGVVFAAMGEAEDALACYKRSLKLDQRLGDRVSLALKLGNIGQAYADLGELDKGERYLRKARVLCEQSDDRTTLTDVRTSLGQVNLARGKIDRATALFAKSVTSARENRDRYQETRALIYLAIATLRAGGDAAEALELARTATEIARAMPMPVGEYYGLAIQAQALVALGRAGESLELSTRALEAIAEVQQPEGAEEIMALHAEIAAAAGDAALAAETIARARAETERKAAKLKDQALRQAYLSSPLVARIQKLHAALT
jgi:serine/threonine protein kinase/predicted ATPase